MSQAVSTNVAAGGDKVMQLCALGVGLWAVGVASAHLAAPFGAFTAGLAPALLIISVPIAWACVRLIARFGGRTTLLEATALASTPALLLDGVAFTWVPHLYSVVETEQRQAAAWLLWFVGAALAIAWVRTARRSG